MTDQPDAPLQVDESDSSLLQVCEPRQPRQPNVAMLVVLTWAIVLGTYVCMMLMFLTTISFFSQPTPTTMPLITITTEQARAYKEHKGHYPLIIGEEYLYMSNFVELIEASSDHNSIVVRNRFGDRTTISIEDLDWKPERKPR